MVFVRTTVDRVVAAASTVNPAVWQQLLDRLFDRVAGRFTRVEPRRRATRFVAGLLAELPTKNCWTIAEHVGDSSPAGMQHLLSRAVWDADAVRDDLRDYVVEHVGDPEGVLVLDETGDLKKGDKSVGVQRQYTGTAGRIENSQMSVFLVYATTAGHAVIDRELYLPVSWTDDRDRCDQAGVPVGTVFATKTVLARRMIDRAVGGGVPVRWVTADEAYGKDGALRAALEQRTLGYVLAVACDHRIAVLGGSTMRVDTAARVLPNAVWHRLSAGAGVKGQRWYDWAWVRVHSPEQGGYRWLLVRRNRRTGVQAFYVCYSPTAVALGVLVRVAGRRWSIEEAFQTSKGQVGLDQHQVRTWTSWYRWTTLAMLAHAFLAVATAHTRATTATSVEEKERLIPLTLNEIRRLHIRLATTGMGRCAAHALAWSQWRRRHQHIARRSHYQRQHTQEHELQLEY
jgi:SRSO17 transposase